MELYFRGINFREFVIFKEFHGINFREFEAQNSRKLIPRIFNSAKINPFKVIINEIKGIRGFRGKKLNIYFTVFF